MLCNSENIKFAQTRKGKAEPRAGDDINDAAAISKPENLYMTVLNNEMNSPMESYLAPSVVSPQAAT